MKFRKGLEKITPYKPGKPIEEVKRALGLKEVYKLASNEIPFAPLYIRKAILEELKNINRYPESNCFYLRKALAKKIDVKEECIIFGNGSDELITLTLRVFVEDKDEVIIAYPTFLMYEIQAQAQGAKIIKVPLRDCRYDLEAMAKKVNAKTKVIFIANPDNPTGTYVNHRELSDFLKKIPKNIFVYLDEAYREFAPSDFPRPDIFLKERGNIFYVRTFSKVYGLAGLRIGYGVTTEETAKAINKIRDPFNINRFAQVAALSALKNENFLKKTISYVFKEKQYLYKELQSLNISFIKSATNFILVDFKDTASGLCDYFLKNGVIVRELTAWGFKNFFRVTVGLHKENEKFTSCLKKYLSLKGEQKE
jgi:histidinol-phosphate aminotransferase